MELNHILIALGVTLVLTVLAYFLTRKKYYKEYTVYLYFETDKKTYHDRVVFVEKGYNSPEDLLAEITKQREDVEEVAGKDSNAVLKNMRIFEPKWKT